MKTLDRCFEESKVLTFIFRSVISLISSNNNSKNHGKCVDSYISQIDHFIVVCLVAWPLNESEAGVDLVLIETSLLLLCKFILISMRTASLA